MNFGEKLRQLRNDKKLTQPQLAGAMGIEQSYLSKLENDKSLPSNDVLKRILDVLETDVGDLVSDLDRRERNQLCQLPVVAEHFGRQRQALIGNRKRWLLLCALSLSVGIALIYAGHAHLFFSNVVYHYKSHGVVLDGESKEIFLHPGRFIPAAANGDAATEFMDSIKARIDEVYFDDTRFQGNIFNVPVEGGSRTYYLENETEIDPWQNKLIVFVGVFLTIIGLAGLLMEGKLSRERLYY